MFSLSINNIVTISRGDSFSVPLFLNAGTGVSPIRRILKSGEYVYFAIERPNECFANACLKKKFDKENLNNNGDVQIEFSASEMNALCPGTYYYEIKASFLDESGKQIINTVVEKTRFIVL